MKAFSLRYLIMFVAIVLLDFFSKKAAMSFERELVDVSESFKIYINEGMFLGYFAKTTKYLRISFVILSYSVLLMITCLFNYFLDSKLIWLKVGITMLVAGITGNCIDKVIYGGVVDWVTLPFFSNHHFNIADVFQWFAFSLVLVRLFKDEEKIWKVNNKRNKFLIDSKYQMDFTKKVVGILMICFLSGSLLTFSFLLNLRVPPTKSEIMMFGFFSFVSLLFTIVFATLYILLMTHKTAGSIYAFERECLNSTLRFREGDYHTEEFLRIFNKMKKSATDDEDLAS